MTERRKDGPYWVKTWIAELSQLTDQFRDEDGKVDYEALGREEYQFRMALARKDFSISFRAKKVWEEALGTYNKRIDAVNKGNEKKAGAATRDGLANKTESQAVSAEPEVFNLAYGGRNGHVVITQEQYAEFINAVGNKAEADNIVDWLDRKIDEGEVVKGKHINRLYDMFNGTAHNAKVKVEAETAKAKVYASNGRKDRITSDREEIAKIANYYDNLTNKNKAV